MATKELKKIDPEELKRILEEHQLWWNFEGKIGCKAYNHRRSLLFP